MGCAGNALSACPAFESLLAVSEQLGVVFKVEFKSLLGRGIKLAVFVGMIPTDLRAMLVNGAPAIGQQVRAAGLYEEIPAVVVFIDLDIFMRDLPQKVFEVGLFPGRIDLLGDVGTTL